MGNRTTLFSLHIWFPYSGMHWLWGRCISTEFLSCIVFSRGLPSSYLSLLFLLFQNCPCLRRIPGPCFCDVMGQYPGDWYLCKRYQRKYSINLNLYYPAQWRHGCNTCHCDKYQCHGFCPCLEFGSHCDLPSPKVCRKIYFKLSGFSGYSGALLPVAGAMAGVLRV